MTKISRLQQLEQKVEQLTQAIDRLTEVADYLANHLAEHGLPQAETLDDEGNDTGGFTDLSQRPRHL